MSESKMCGNVGKIGEVMDLLKEEYGVPEVGDRGTPLESLVQVILSQNTNDKNRDRAWRSLKRSFENLGDVINTDVDDIADAISVAGLHNTKAERIKKCLEEIKERRGELDLSFLEDMDVEEAKNWLRQLPGIGPKSAAVVLNFSFGKETFPVDTHVFRVTKRLGLVPEKTTREKAHEILEEKVPDGRKQEFHINLIKHGRKICIARKPRCERCSLSGVCDYFARNRPLDSNK